MSVKSHLQISHIICKNIKNVFPPGVPLRLVSSADSKKALLMIIHPRFKSSLFTYAKCLYSTHSLRLFIPNCLDAVYTQTIPRGVPCFYSLWTRAFSLSFVLNSIYTLPSLPPPTVPSLKYIYLIIYILACIYSGKQACKPRSYASSKLRRTYRVSDSQG